QYTCFGVVPAKNAGRKVALALLPGSTMGVNAGSAWNSCFDRTSMLKCRLLSRSGDFMYPADTMSSEERRAASSLAAVFAFRMLGLFMVLPVLATYGQDLEGATALLIGMAIGAYGITQAFLQIPFGMLSDRIGRKPVIIGGLLLFALGGLVAAQADSMMGVIAGRVLRGAGAIAA